MTNNNIKINNDDIQITNGSIVIVKCIYNDIDIECPDENTFPCHTLSHLIYSNSIGCNKLIIDWSTYLVYKKFFKEVKDNE